MSWNLYTCNRNLCVFRLGIEFKIYETARRINEQENIEYIEYI